MIKLPYKELKIWQKSIELTKSVYLITKKFPKEEVYGLTSQIRRSAVSIPSNIAEGSQRTSDKEFANFILISKGSLAELETQLILAKDFNYANEDEIENLLTISEELNKMLFAFHKTLIAAR